MKKGPFVDLRMKDETSGEAGFWPAFTDIMTVIVIIFLSVMLTLLVRNMDLVDQLRASLESERTATAQVQSTSDMNSDLSIRLKQLEQESSMLRMRLMDLGEEHGRSLSQLSASEQESLQLKSDISAITQAQEITLREKSVLEQDNVELTTAKLVLEKRQLTLEASKLALENSQSALKQHQAELTEQLQQRLQELAEQQHLYLLRMEEIGKLKNSRDIDIDRLKKLELEYANLEIKYNRLIRPARSQLGKVVTLVRYQKLDGKLSIELKSPTDANYGMVNGTELHKRLSVLQEKHGEKLYVRIIFPDESGLSYTEAWNLTESLLRMYDYYYQE